MALGVRKEKKRKEEEGARGRKGEKGITITFFFIASSSSLRGEGGEKKRPGRGKARYDGNYTFAARLRKREGRGPEGGGDPLPS